MYVIEKTISVIKKSLNIIRHQPIFDSIVILTFPIFSSLQQAKPMCKEEWCTTLQCAPEVSPYYFCLGLKRYSEAKEEEKAACTFCPRWAELNAAFLAEWAECLKTVKPLPNDKYFREATSAAMVLDALVWKPETKDVDALLEYQKTTTFAYEGALMVMIPKVCTRALVTGFLNRNKSPLPPKTS